MIEHVFTKLKLALLFTFFWNLESLQSKVLKQQMDLKF